MIVFGDFDLSGFWKGGEYEEKTYIGKPLTNELLASVEHDLGHKLPKSYIELMSQQNGGIPKNRAHSVDQLTTWSADHIAISAIFAIDRGPKFSLCGQLGSKFMEQGWEYPKIGVYFAGTPSAGHHMVGFDYRDLVEGEEPSVVFVDQEMDYRITTVAPNFESFIRGLQSVDDF